MSDDETATSLARMFKGIHFVFVGNILGLGSSFLMRFVGARELGRSDYGLIVLGLALVNICSMLSLLGVHKGVVQRIPRTDDVGKIVRFALGVVVTTSVVVSALLLVFSRPIGVAFASPEGVPTLSLFILSVPVVSVVKLVAGVFRGSEDPFGKVLTSDLVYRTGGAVIVASGSYVGLQTVQIGQIWFLGLSVGACLSVTILARRLSDSLVALEAPQTALGAVSRARVWLRTNRDIAGSLLALSLPLMLSESLRIVLKNSDNFLVGYYLTTSEVGAYDAAFTLAQSLNLVASTFGFLLLPVLSDLHSDGKSEQLRRTYKRMSKLITMFTLPVYLVLVGFPGLVLGIVFGSEYTVGALSLVFISTTFFAHVLLGLNGQGLVAIGRTRVIPFGNALALLVNIPLNIVLIPRFGIAGAAAASMLGYLTLNLFFSVLLYRDSGLQPLSRQVLTTVAFGTGSFVGTFWITRSVVGPDLSLFVTVAVFGPVYAVVVYVFGITSRDVDQIVELLTDR